MAPSLVVLLEALFKEMMFYTYAHYKPDNSVFYIGKGKCNRAFDKISRSKKWKAVVAQEGDYKVEVLAKWETEKEAFEHEIFLIDCFRQMGAQLVNVSKGGHGASGYRHTEEYVEYMKSIMSASGNAFFGKTHDEKTKQKISQTKKKNPSRPWLGKTRDEATRSKISASLMGRSGTKHTEETKAQMSLVRKGKSTGSPSEETRKKLSESVKASWILRRQKVRKEV
jgi:hypothetical protein